ncbi:unnamed protein product [Microthlaspi erraticum]|uniref:DUF7610 domain-containing protein n=1 Tax=Microthlaspi erraticum TaxID=1685480 RepID=A0A6D2IMC6_9BRAS|nr:unnamed protein product [Microthlaspi erraticum]
MKTKVKINAVLEKKLEELECLREALNSNYDDTNLHREIQLRVIFAQTLLTAEIVSRQVDMEGQDYSEERLELACMAKKLKDLEEAVKTNQRSGHDDISVIELETNDGVVDGETGSVYSLVESCDDEFGKAEEEEEEEEEDAEQCPLFQDASSEEKGEVVMFPAVSEDEEDVAVIEVKKKGRGSFRGLVCVGLVGLVGGMVSLLGYIGDEMKEDCYFPTPT